ncbi:putative ankyrin repeat protein like [Verticillium longisporum]|nr:putative ankyrin repeat protein like [Verticillium longisporum]
MDGGKRQSLSRENESWEMGTEHNTSPSSRISAARYTVAMTDPSATTLPPEAIELAGRMYDAARSGDATVFAQALPAGLPVNMTNEKGDSLLMLAAYYGHAELVKLCRYRGSP